MFAMRTLSQGGISRSRRFIHLLSHRAVITYSFPRTLFARSASAEIQVVPEISPSSPETGAGNRTVYLDLYRSQRARCGLISRSCSSSSSIDIEPRSYSSTRINYIERAVLRIAHASQTFRATRTGDVLQQARSLIHRACFTELRLRYC